MKRNCNRFSILITCYVDGELDAKEKGQVETHLNSCSSCNEAYLQELRVKNMVKKKLSNVKAPAYLQNRIRRILIRNGNRPGFWQLVHSLFVYRPVTASFALALIVFLVFLPTVQTLDSTFNIFSARSKTAQLKGEIICLDCEFLSQDNKEHAHDPGTHRHGLKADDDTIWTFVRGDSNQELYQDEKLLKKKALVSGIIFRNSQYIYVQEYKLL